MTRSATRQLRRVCAALALSLAHLSPAPGAPVPSPAGSLGGLHLAQRGLETWTPDSGLAGSWVRDIVQGPDGFLWVATSGGLSRFDGRRFVNFTAALEPELPANSVTALATGASGQLWIGLEHGGVRRFADGHLRRDERLDDLPPAAVRSLLETGDGTLWIGTSAGLWRWRPETGLTLVAPDAAGRKALINRLRADGVDGVRVRTREHGLWRASGGGVTVEPDAPGCVGLDFAVAPGGFETTSCVGGIWQRTSASAAWRLLDPAPRVARLMVDREGSLWYGDDDGLVLRSAEGVERLAAAGGLGDPRARAFFEDERGEVWIGTFSHGLSRLRRGAIAAFGLPEGLPIRGTTAVVGRADGSFWLGSVDSGVYLWSHGGGVLRRWGVADGLPSDRVWAIAQDPLRAEHAWFGTEDGLVELDGTELRRIAHRGAPSEATVSTLFADPLEGGALWVGRDSGGAEELRAGAATRHDRANGLGIGIVRFFHRSRQGVLLAGGAEGLFWFDGARWHKVEFGGAEVRALRAVGEQDDGTLWFSSDASGLLRWSNGSLTRLGEREGLPFNRIFSVTVDGVGGLWLSGNEGLARVRLADFDRWARGELDSVPTELFSAREGLRDRECNGWGSPASGRLADGVLAYPTLNGLALVDPRRVVEPGLAAGEILIDAAWTGERELSVAAPLRLAPDERQLRLRFTALEFLHPESVSFRYRLEGADPDWAPAGQQRAANYSNLAPGSYRFRLQARLPGREWTEAARQLEVTVAPRIWEATWFRSLALALGLLGVVATFRWRTRVERGHADALFRERQLLREVIDTSPNPIFAKRRDVTYALANRAAAAVYGLYPKDLIGRTEADLGGRVQGMDRLGAIDSAVLASGEEWIEPEAQVVDAAGAHRWFRVVKRPLRGLSGEVEQVLGTAVDVTDFKLAELRLRQHERELRASQQELRELASRLIRAQEDERRRLAREIHDDLTQRLAGLGMLAGGLAQAVAQGRAENVGSRVAELGRELERLASDAQVLARELHPSLLENLGLEAAIRSECATFAERTGLRVGFESCEVPEGLEPEVSLVLYRITQEALRNVLSHARSGDARVALLGRDGGVTLTVEDAGAGFDPSAVLGRAGMGLASMAERARLIGSVLEVDSAPGRGTRIVVRAGPGAAQRAARPASGPG